MFFRHKQTYQPLPLPDRITMDDTAMAQAAQSFYDSMKQRHTVRDYSDRPVSRDVIQNCIRTAGTAPSGANHQPWHFVAIANAHDKQTIRHAAEQEEETFYAGRASDEWLKALEPIGTGATKPHLEKAPWLIVIFAQSYGQFDDGTKYKNYYVPQSTSIATGFLITALHQAGLVSLTHTPSPMKFLNSLCERPASEKPLMILAVGHPADDATVPAVAKIKKPLDDILSWRE